MGLHMVSTVFAFLVTTIVLLAFKTTRWMGAVALFVLLSVSPVLASLLLILAAVVAYVLLDRPSLEVLSKKLPWRH